MELSSEVVIFFESMWEGIKIFSRFILFLKFAQNLYLRNETSRKGKMFIKFTDLTEFCCFIQNKIISLAFDFGA